VRHTPGAVSAFALAPFLGAGLVSCVVGIWLLQSVWPSLCRRPAPWALYGSGRAGRHLGPRPRHERPL